MSSILIILAAVEWLCKADATASNAVWIPMQHNDPPDGGRLGSTTFLTDLYDPDLSSPPWVSVHSTTASRSLTSSDGSSAIATEANTTAVVQYTSPGVICWGDMHGTEPPNLPSVRVMRAGHRSVCAITETGYAVCWGQHIQNVEVPSDLGLVRDIMPYGYASFDTGVCAITEEVGTLRCWGVVPFDIPEDIPDNLTQLVFYRTPRGVGPISCCVLEGSGNVTCFGNGAVAPPDDLGPVRQLASWRGTVCAATEAGMVRCWNDELSPGWTWTGGAARSIAIASAGRRSVAFVCANLEAGYIECVPNPGLPSYAQIPGLHLELVAGDSFWAGLDVKNNVLALWGAFPPSLWDHQPGFLTTRLAVAANADYICTYSHFDTVATLELSSCGETASVQSSASLRSLIPSVTEPNVPYRFCAPANGTYILETCSSDVRTKIYLPTVDKQYIGWSKGDTGDAIPDNPCPASGEAARVHLTAGECVAGYLGHQNPGMHNLTVHCSESALTDIAKETASSIVCFGASMSGLEPPKGLPPVQLIRGGYRDMCAILETGNATCWGLHAANLSVPGDLGPVVDILPFGRDPLEAGACAITKGVGRLRCWGAVPFDIPADLPNNLTQVVIHRPAPQFISSRSTFGPMSCCVLEASGNVTCFGNHSTPPPADVGGVVQLTTWKDVVCAVSQEGKIWCWNKAGMTNGHPAIAGFEWDFPLHEKGAFTERRIAVSAHGFWGSLCAVTEGNVILCAPHGPASRRPGRGTPTPDDLNSLTGQYDAMDIVSGHNFWCAWRLHKEKPEGQVRCWTSTSEGWLPDVPITRSNNTELTAGEDFFCAYSVPAWRSPVWAPTPQPLPAPGPPASETGERIEVCNIKGANTCRGSRETLTKEVSLPLFQDICGYHRYNMVVEPGSCRKTVPWSGVDVQPVDWNGDGLMDLVIRVDADAPRYLERVNRSHLEERFGAKNPFAGIRHPGLQGRKPDEWLEACQYSTSAGFAVVDWDGDGDLDLLVGARDNGLHYHENDGTGTLVEVSRQDGPFANLTIEMLYTATMDGESPFYGAFGIAKRLQAVDWDGDGDLDLVVFWAAVDNAVPTAVRYYERQGLWGPLIPTSTSQFPLRFMAPVWTSGQAEKLVTTTALSKYGAAVLADWDQDGEVDAIVVDAADKVRFYRRLSDKSVVEALGEQHPLGSFESLGVAVHLSMFHLPTSDRSGMYYELQHERRLRTRFLHVVDWYGDGLPDIMAFDCEQTVILSRTAEESFHELTNQHNPLGNIQVMDDSQPQFIDFNGDNYTDIISWSSRENKDMSTFGDSPLNYFEGQPDGSFQAVSVEDPKESPFYGLFWQPGGGKQFTYDYSRDTMIFAVDWNADGQVDLLYRNYTSELELFTALAPGRLNRRAILLGHLGVPHHSIQCFQAADWDGDNEVEVLAIVTGRDSRTINEDSYGALFDILVWDFTPGPLMLYKLAGEEGSFSDENSTAITDAEETPLPVATSFHAVDFDLDGDLDLLLYTGSELLYYERDSRGLVLRPDHPLAAVDVQIDNRAVNSKDLKLRAFDIDGDGALELVSGSASATQAATRTMRVWRQGTCDPPSACNQAGVCSPFTGTCLCLAGRTLSDCSGCSQSYYSSTESMLGQVPMCVRCPVDGNGNVCYQHGVCHDDDLAKSEATSPQAQIEAKGTGNCRCSPGFYGNNTQGLSTCKDGGCQEGAELGPIRVDGSRACQPCAAGRGKDTVGLEACTACPPGRFALAGRCALCDAGTYSGETGAVSAVSCRPCPAGTFNSANGSDSALACQACPVGATTVSEGQTNANSCLQPQQSEVVGSLLVPSFNCTAGRSCSLRLQGNLGGPHRLAIFHNCSTRDSVAGVPNEGVSQVADEEGRFYRWSGALQSSGGSYELCWCAGMQGLTCSTPSAFQIRAGQLILQGPYSKLQGELLAVRTPSTIRLGPIRGEDLHSSDHLRIATRCDPTAAGVAGAGELNVEASETDTGVELTAVFPSFLAAPGDYWLCWAKAVEDGFAAPVGQVTVQGPVDRQSASCAVGQHCVVSGILGLDLQAGDEFMPSTDCVVPLDGLPRGGIYTAPGSEAGSFEVGAAGVPMIIRTSTYRLCWRRLPHSWVSFGFFSATGPQGDLQATCTLGRRCLLSDEAGQPLRGVGLAVGDSLLIVAGSCGAAQTLDAFGFPAWKLPRSSTTGERGTFDFGYMPLNGTPGVYEACWCPSGSSCSSPSDFLATAGQVRVHCPPGTYAIGAEGRKVCAECPRGAQCPGGLPDDAVSISCPEGTTSSPGSSNSSSCVCRPGFRFLETQQECQECPVGRYKSSIANAGTCSLCPGELTTFGRGSTSSSSCIEVPQGSQDQNQVPVRQAENSTEVWVVGMRLSLQGLTANQLEASGWTELLAKLRSAVARQTQSSLVQVHVTRATVASASDRRLSATQPLTELQVEVNTRSQEAAALATADLGAAGFLLEVAAAAGIVDGVQVSSAPHVTRAEVRCRAFMSVPPGVAIISPDECHCAEGAGYEPTTAACRPCPRGQYKVSVGNVACERCAASQTTLAEGATSLASCVCEAGTSAAQPADGQGDIVCEGCPPGFYCDGTGAGDGGKQSCPARSDTVVGGRARALPDCQCNAGHYPDEETGSCEPCKAGTYKPGLGNGLCQLSCPQGATSNPGARSNFDCYCLRGSYASVGDDSTLLACVACPPFGLDCRGGFEQRAAAGSSSRRLLAEDRPIHAMPVAKAGYFQTGVSTAVLCKITDNGGRSQCQGGMGCVALRTNGTTLKESLPQCYGEYGSACAVGSGGMLCGNCPAGFARHTYPKTCTRCSGNVYLGVVGSILAEILFQASFILFLTALAAQSSASKSLHSAVIRIGSQWLAACSVIAFFDLQDIKGFSWAQEEADIMAQSGQEPVGGPLALFQWPAVLSDYLQNLFAFAGLFPTIASVQEQLECLAEEVYGTVEARMLVPALYHLVYPLLVMFSCLVVCAAFVYLGVPICLKLGVKIVPDIETETVKRARLKSKRASAQVQLDEVSQKLTAWGLKRCQLEESVVGGLDLAELEGHMEDCISAMKALFPHERSLAAQMFLTRFWDSLEAPMREHGVNREHLTEYVQHTAELEEFKQQIENALRNPTALADEVNAVPRPLLTSSMSLKRSLVRPTSTSSTLEAREMGYILGLFTRSPAPRTLLLQCTPVLWLSINNMWPYLLQTYLKMVWCQPILIETPARQLKQEQRLIPFPDIQCGSDSHWPVQLCAIVGLSLWCVGGPTALFFRVRAFGNQKYSPEATRMFGYILEGYEPQWWWWDILVKRIDVGLMMVATYTSLALDDKAKLMLYPAISNAALVVNALARPLDNRQAGLLDYIEGTALAVRCALFSIIAVLLTLNTGMAASGIAGGALAIWVTLFLITVLVHTFAQYMRKFTDLDAEERQQLEQGAQAQRTVPSESSRSTVAKIKTQAGKVTAALHRQRRYWMQGELEVCWADITGAEAILAKPDSEAGNGRCKRVLAHLRDLFLRRTERHQREALAHAFSEFHKLWLTHFSMVNIEFDFRIIFVLTLASKVVSTKTKSKHVLPLWMRAAEDVAMEVTKKQRKGTPFSADDVCIMTERFRELNSEEAEELNSVVKRMLGHSTYRVLGQRSTRSTQATLAAPTTPPITRKLSTSEVMDAEGSRFSSQHLRSDEAHDEATATSGKRAVLLQSL